MSDELPEAVVEALVEMTQDMDDAETPEQKAKREADAAAHAVWLENHRRKQEEDIRLAVPREIATLRKEAAEKLAAADKLEALLKLYPNIRKRTGRWNKVAFYSKDVNATATRFDIRYNCGCCNDSPLEVWPYAETLQGNVYTDPPDFRVGRKEPWGGGDLPEKGWDKQMRDAGISESIISAVSMRFKGSAERVKKLAAEIYDGHEVEDDEPPV